MIFESSGLGQFVTDNGHIVDPMSGTCLCKGFYYGQKRNNDNTKTCKHLDFFKEWGYKKVSK